MKALIVEFHHEAHSFTPLRTRLEDFRGRYWLEGDDARRELSEDPNGWMVGLLDTFEAAGVAVHPGLCTACMPGGEQSERDYFSICNELLASIDDEISRHGPFDIAVILLHGAMAVTARPDPEGELVKAVRARLGADVLLGVGLSFNGNVGASLVQTADLVIAGRQSPSVDLAERGALLARLLMQRAPWARLPVARAMRRTRHVRLPIVVPMRLLHTVSGPFAELLAQCAEWRERLGLDDLAVVGGFPYAHHDRACVSILATGHAPACLQAVRALAELAWQHVSVWQLPPPELDLLKDWLDQRLMSNRQGHLPQPLVIADAGDDPSAGAPGADGSALSRVLRSGCRFVAAHVDARIVRRAQAVDVGGELSFDLYRCGPGAEDRRLLGVWTAQVVACGPVRYVRQSPVRQGQACDGGMGAVLRIESGWGACGHVVVTSERLAFDDPDIFLSQGLTLDGVDVVLLKSSTEFRAGFAAAVQVPQDLRTVDGGGWTTADWWRKVGPRVALEGSYSRQRPVLPWVNLDKAAWDRAIEQDFEQQERAMLAS